MLPCDAATRLFLWLDSTSNNESNSLYTETAATMDELIGLLPLPAFCMGLAMAIPNSWANRRRKRLGNFVVVATGLQFLLALCAAVIHAVGIVSGTSVIAQLEGPIPGLGNAVYVDGVALLMLLLVSFIGLVVIRYSIRYLDGESSQGRYFRWLSVTIGAVSLMVIAGNLLLFFLAWVMTSFGLHHLLLHYSERPIARRAAWTKFAISRLGDAFLLAAIILTYQSFGTLELRVLFAKLAATSGDASVVPMHEAIGWLLAFGAITKSAQVPFHTWLPDTLETPTPVSALMHAGIVNAGGYLIIRMSPLMLQAPAALLTLAVVGTVTAFLGGIVMMTPDRHPARPGR